ncbi:hypothetical protein M758_9G009000, partial [Ceratodon purpureus]
QVTRSFFSAQLVACFFILQVVTGCSRAGPAPLLVKIVPISMVSLPYKLATNGLENQFSWFFVLASIWSIPMVDMLI